MSAVLALASVVVTCSCALAAWRFFKGLAGRG